MPEINKGIFLSEANKAEIIDVPKHNPNEISNLVKQMENQDDTPYKNEVSFLIKKSVDKTKALVAERKFYIKFEMFSGSEINSKFFDTYEEAEGFLKNNFPKLFGTKETYINE